MNHFSTQYGADTFRLRFHMSKEDDAWTTTHDLALIYVALAYGTDYELSDGELNSITTALQGWCSTCDREAVQEVVVEAMAVFTEDEPEREVVSAMQSLRQSLSQEERCRALEEIVRIARADGVLLRSERSLISTLAAVWEVKGSGRTRIGEAPASDDEQIAWTILHDMGLMYVVVAHSTDNDLSEAEISAMIERLLQWQPDHSEDDVRNLLHEVLQYYAAGPEESELKRAVASISESLPMLQRLALLDDLVYIAEADDALTTAERDMIFNLAEAWNLNVRLNGTAQA